MDELHENIFAALVVVGIVETGTRNRLERGLLDGAAGELQDSFCDGVPGGGAAIATSAVCLTATGTAGNPGSRPLLHDLWQ